MTVSSNHALRHLNNLKPTDGWSILEGVGANGCGMKLLRRNVPLSDNYFSDIHYDPSSKCVVGILSTTREGRVIGQVLVDEVGRPSSQQNIVHVSSWKKVLRSSPSTSSATRTTAATAASSTRTTGTSSIGGDANTLSLEQNMDLLKYGGLFVVGSILLKALISSLVIVYILVLPILYVYALNQCPSAESFDAKKELKRVLRGHHLPEAHPDKPKGFLEGLAARVAATVTAELATLPGYEISMMNLAGAAIVATVTVPTAQMECYWIGVLGEWRYITSRKLPEHGKRD